MMGSSLTRALILALGYAYPSYECFKTIEKKKPEIQQLRFWLLSIFKRVGDGFISWPGEGTLLPCLTCLIILQYAAFQSQTTESRPFQASFEADAMPNPRRTVGEEPSRLARCRVRTRARVATSH
ncbi:unnamed protein product [Spirodela intermedia]|uniref:Uncharacterized protein n=1 Tax=Spirodela intermedia TaxID=51605 RepID=A0A7I8IDU8_SPIIN|nr:unnamed protein product [Spirodela intermedia]CAA6655946.1 unnamed protein product [Spirodela intermedia]